MTPMEFDSDLLVLGYGNTLREDDCAGPRTAERVESLGLRRVSVIVSTQLSPEHAEAVAHSQFAVFVDAATDGRRAVQLHAIGPAVTSEVTAHALEPPTLLALARDLYGHAPQAWLLTIPVARLGFGEEVSPLAQRGIGHAVEQIVALHESICGVPG